MRRAAVTRPRITALLDSLAERRLVYVVGDTASGKSVAVGDWAAGRTDVVTVTLGPGAHGPRELLAEFVAATEPLCPGLRAWLEPELAARTASAEADDPTTLAAVLAGALAAGWAERGCAAFTVVLDALDSVTDPAGLEFVADLVRLFPRSVGMVVLARTQPPFAVRRLDAAGEYGELGPRALRFEPDETAALFAAAGLVLDDAAARTLTEACGGWAGGLRLAVEAALTDGVDGLVERLGRSSAPALLAAVALTPLDDDTRGTVRAMTVLGRVEREVTAGRPDVVDRLDRLTDRGLLTADEAGWTLTALARHAVETQMPPDPAAVREVLRDCVRMAVDAGCAEPALRWAAQLGEPDVVRAAVEAVGTAAVDSGSPLLADAAACLPVPVGDVGVDGLLASYFASRGDLARALAYLGDDAAPLPVAIGWRVAAALWMHGDATGAQSVTDRCAGPAAPADESQLAAVRASLGWGRGDGPAAREHADAALALARQAGDDAALGTAWVVQALVAALEGDLNRNQRCYSTALEHAVAARDVMTQLRVRCNVGSHLTETGRCREAVVELDEAVRLGEATGQRTRIALARLNQGQARLGLGLLDEALVDAEAALSMWTQVESPMAAYAQQLRGDVLARRGDVNRAAGAYRAAVAAAEEQQDAQTLGPALAGLARCLVADDPAEARRCADRAVGERVALGSVPALLASGWVLRLAGDHAGAGELARAARDESARRDNPASLAQALVLDVLGAPDPVAGDVRLSEARALLDEIGDAVGLAELDEVIGALARDRGAQSRARARLHAVGVRDSAALIAGPLAVLHERRGSDVELRTLGAFGVRVGDTAVPSSAWQSRKARDLVKIIAARRGRPITRDALADLLWPESDGAGNRLSVALSTARAVFDPAKRHPADHVIVADRTSVRLDLQTVTLDLDTYLAASDHALAAAGRNDPDAVELLTAAAAAYSGDFCEEDPYEAWAAATRDEARARQQQIVRTLAQSLVDAGRPDDAVPWWITLLGLDEYDERGHLDLIRALVRVGRHGEARRSYRTYQERMAEIDVEPAAFPQRPRNG